VPRRQSSTGCARDDELRSRTLSWTYEKAAEAAKQPPSEASIDIVKAVVLEHTELGPVSWCVVERVSS
jgi:hypothetical protein